jgi:hypothetical protein
MNTEKNFKANFKQYKIPVELAELLKFQNRSDHSEEFSAGFYLGADYTDKSGLASYSSDENFTNAIIEFARADGSGSTYALWIIDGNKNLNEAPIVAFGSEGGIHIVAEDIKGLLEILTFDTEPTIGWEEVYYYKDEDEYDPSEYNEEYKKWVFEKFNITSTDDADQIVENAQMIYEERFQNWLKKYYQ